MSDEKIGLEDGFEEWLKNFPLNPWGQLERDFLGCGREFASKHLVNLLSHVWMVARGREVGKIDELQRKIRELNERHGTTGNKEHWDKVGMGVQMTNLRAENARLKAVLGDYVDANQRDQKKIKELENERRGLADLPKSVAQAALDNAPESMLPPKQYVPEEQRGDQLLFWMAHVTGVLRSIAPNDWEEARRLFLAVKEDWAKGK